MKSELTREQAKIIAVCTSPLTGTKKINVIQGVLMENHGLLGDGHAENQTHRQLSLLANESIQKIRRLRVLMLTLEILQRTSQQRVLNSPVSILEPEYPLETILLLRLHRLARNVTAHVKSADRLASV